MINYKSSLGAWIDGSGWVPSPRYLLRRNRVLPILEKLITGDLLEIGCGAGALLFDLRELGFSCSAVEFSPDARNHAKLFGSTILEDANNIQQGSVDLVVAFDVLEHIDDDSSALRNWVSYLRPDGHLMVTVPCHMSKWGASDVWAGHFRRYERAELTRLVESMGVEVELVETYGFPLANITSWLRNLLYARKNKVESTLEVIEKTKRSGVERTIEQRVFPILSSPIGRFFLSVSYFLQSLFVKSEFGDGYIVLARKVRC